MSYKARTSTRYQTSKTPVLVRREGTFSWAKGTVLNLSRGGVMVHCTVPFDKGLKVDLEFATKDDTGAKHVRKLEAEVMWKKGSLHGLQFINKSADGKKIKKP